MMIQGGTRTADSFPLSMTRGMGGRLKAGTQWLDLKALMPK